MPAPFTWVDSFSDGPFAGNPAAVVLLEEEGSDDWMRAVAAELGLSETAFLHPRDDGWSLRWFTPRVEVDLCGHATLAAAHVLWSEGHLLPAKEARFHTQSGLLTASDAGDGWIRLDFPANAPQEGPADAQLLEALRLTAAPRWLGRTGHYQLLLLASPAEVGALEPDFAALRALGPDCPALIVTAEAAAAAPHDVVSRVFCPGVGIDEDPVTGAAHTVLAPFWSARLGRSELTCRQASSRGGTVRVVDRGERVDLIGRAATVIRGALHA